MIRLSRWYLIILSLIPLYLLISCEVEGDRTPQTLQKETEVSRTSDHTNDQQSPRYEGEYCAEVHYYNPNTGTRSQYRLIILAEDNTLERINFRTGYLDEDHFQTRAFDGQGRVSITTDRGYRYSIQVIGESAGCFDRSD